MKGLSKKYLVFAIVMLIALSSGYVYALVNQNQGWHPLQQVSINSGSTTSVDNNANNKADNADLADNAGLLDGLDSTDFQRAIGVDCGADNYVFGVSDTGVLSCRPDLQGTNVDESTVEGWIFDPQVDTNAGIWTITGVWTYNAIPAFNGGVSGTSAPFTVDSTQYIANLNADYLDGVHATFFQDDINPNDCTSGQYVSGISDTGALACSTPSGSAGVASLNALTGVITIAPVAGGNLLTVATNGQNIELNVPIQNLQTVTNAGPTTSNDMTISKSSGSAAMNIKTTASGQSSYLTLESPSNGETGIAFKEGAFELADVYWNTAGNYLALTDSTGGDMVKVNSNSVTLLSTDAQRVYIRDSTNQIYQDVGGNMLLGTTDTANLNLRANSRNQFSVLGNGRERFWTMTQGSGANYLDIYENSRFFVIDLPTYNSSLAYSSSKGLKFVSHSSGGFNTDALVIRNEFTDAATTPTRIDIGVPVYGNSDISTTGTMYSGGSTSGKAVCTADGTNCPVDDIAQCPPERVTVYTNAGHTAVGYLERGICTISSTGNYVDLSVISLNIGGVNTAIDGVNTVSCQKACTVFGFAETTSSCQTTVGGTASHAGKNTGSNYWYAASTASSCSVCRCYVGNVPAP